MKQNNTLAIIVVIMALVSFLCLSLSVSYSFIISSVSSSNVQTIATSNLDAQISFTESGLVAEPMSDADGLSQNSYGLIDIVKENDYSVYYTINLKYDTASLPSGVTTDQLLPMENLKVALFEVIDGTVASDPLVGPVRIADLPIGYYDVNDNYQTQYFLANGIFEPGEDTATYAVKVWIDEDILEDYEGYYVYLGANVIQEPLYSKNIYNMSGRISNWDFLESPSNVSVELQNGLYSAVIQENGNYYFENIVSGTYNFKIIFDETVYETTINIGPNSDDYSLGPGRYEDAYITENPMAYSGQDLQRSAYSYYTTPYKIMKLNSYENTMYIPQDNYNLPTAISVSGPKAIGPVELRYIGFIISDGVISINMER